MNNLTNSLFTMTGRRWRSRQGGFTLIELLIVISIILILVGIAAANYQRAVMRSREAVLHQDLVEMRKAIDNYTLDKQAAPQSLDDLVPQYLHVLPVDPITTKKRLGAGRRSGGPDARSGQLWNHRCSFRFGEDVSVRKHRLQHLVIP